jgi:hypothetical protein
MVEELLLLKKKKKKKKKKKVWTAGDRQPEPRSNQTHDSDFSQTSKSHVKPLLLLLLLHRELKKIPKAWRHSYILNRCLCLFANVRLCVDVWMFSI